MTNYEHSLLFGAFVTPNNNPPHRAVELAVAADQSGLDLVTFQDHPYQARFHDTWTLMSYVASKTSQIIIAGNVLNLPLRQPAVLARSSATLDLLSHGRFEMALGAGGFWESIAAMGGPRRTPSEARQALDEAIQIMQQMWATDQQGPIHVAGDHYRAIGVKRGPTPAHKISIWVGGYKPKMLELIGRRADGWLPTLSYLPGGPADLTKLNHQIDDAATAAGRNPGDIRRILNINGHFSSQRRGFLAGPVSAWAQDLAQLTHDYGISGFIFPVDDELTIARIAAEVAPATQEILKT
ncbi:putative F420-dependent oxidoreductase, Rv1855c family [Mycobacteroides abscessus subsp. abscessus]|uniref:LLM class flavin-dependent oxidoreductase n=1 Tax=Mycobacteroides abscessus TaxID=36809 RepID=UPI00092A24A9|nr:LLM class flavin-dependent oxidoreductase [Mycobacteroides abscessus]MDM2350368.1 LLM class flavin-dependent oxidoreductase [Mycobacteroides abscessus]MDM2360951.1 LLM class flavin-dependent oxidoreductase [Mycobacteroides abscessus]QSN53249.1 LLM class flavin-dependent oxidoreductase [Mycobacteroides abscessus subsp. abscessus]SIG93718.1 putative F420-dependent oxidoreductase, Rv1855c family [Mycobacteroides abscessus subsp. abscessus]SIH00918.1 putative F420-dependent oxidoreductase, Rv18